MSIVPDHKYLEHEEFFSQNLTGEKIFIFGSSPIYAINPVNVSNHLLEKGHSYTVYNLGQGSSDAEEQLRTVDLIISQEPKIVVYGIAYQTFYSHGRTIVEKPPESLAAPPKLSDLLSTISLPFNTGLLDNPKFATIRFHLHHEINIVKLQNQNLLLQNSTNKIIGKFFSSSDNIEIDNTIIYQNSERYVSKQIVILVELKKIKELNKLIIKWSFKFEK
mgnify:CR=1 FL=1